MSSSFILSINRLTPITFSFLFAWLTMPSLLCAQGASLDDIMDAHVKALGSKDAIANIENFERKAKVSLEGAFGPMNGTGVEIVDLKGNRYYSHLDLGQYKKIEAMKDGVGWSKGTAGKRDMTDPEIAFAKMNLGASPLLAAYEMGSGILKVKETSTFNDKQCHVIATGALVEYFVNTKTKLLEGMRIPSIGSLVLLDYQTIEGVKLPGKRILEIDSPEMTITYKFNASSINIEVDGALFGVEEAAETIYSADQVIGFLDRDGDKKISKEEADASPELATAFAYVDTSKDGFIDHDEAQAMVDYQKSQQSSKNRSSSEEGKVTAQSIITSMDKNADGKISKGEAREELGLFFDDIDENNDGFIDAAEGKAVAEFVNSNQK